MNTLSILPAVSRETNIGNEERLEQIFHPVYKIKHFQLEKKYFYISNISNMRIILQRRMFLFIIIMYISSKTLAFIAKTKRVFVVYSTYDKNSWPTFQCYIKGLKLI